MSTISIRESFVKVTKKEIVTAVEGQFVVFSSIKWDTDGEKVKLPKAIAVPKGAFEKDFDFDSDGADFLSNHYGWCVKSFVLNK